MWHLSCQLFLGWGGVLGMGLGWGGEGPHPDPLPRAGEGMGVVVGDGERGCYAGVMIEHASVELACGADELLSLQSGIRAFASDQDSTVWLRMSDGEYLRVSSVSVDLAWKFEVFPLCVERHSDFVDAVRSFRSSSRCKALRALAETTFGAEYPMREIDVTALPEDLTEWPFAVWELDVLRRQEGVCELSGEMLHAAEVAVGLLFTDPQGHQLMIASGAFPLSLILSQDVARIEGELVNCVRIPVAEYVSRYLGG